jgi:SAM-dependent methyltransferase
VAAEREGRATEWQEGRAEALPFPDESFDLVTCEHGLQYMPDKVAAVGEMYRVLRPGGRLVLSVTQELATHPFERQLDALMDERLGVAPMREVFALGDAEALRAVLDAASWRQLVIEPVTLATRYPDPERFLENRILVLVAVVPSVQQLAPDDREALLADIRDAIAPLVRDYTVGDEVVMPTYARIAYALR